MVIFKNLKLIFSNFFIIDFYFILIYLTLIIKIYKDYKNLSFQKHHQEY